MSLSEFAVRRPQFTLVMFALLVALGVHALRVIPRAEDPSFPIPVYIVTAVYPGAGPQDMEQLVVDPLEDRLGELDHLKDLDSRAEDGVSTTIVEFEADADPDRKYDEVIREVNAARNELPDGLQRLEVKKIQTTNVAILQFALLSEDAPWHLLEREAKRFEDRLESVSGVKTVERWAFPERQVRVAFDPEKLAQLRIPVRRVLDALQSDNATVPGGGVDIGSRRFSIEAGGHFENIDDVRDTVLAADGARLVRLGDLAHVDWGYAEQTHRARLDGRRTVFVTVTQKDRQNIFDVRDRVMAAIEDLRGGLPDGVVLETVFDQSTQVTERLSGLTRDFALAIALVLVTLLPLGLRASLIVMLSIPLSLAIGVALLHATGFTINQLSIVGFVVALGLLVDDSIVVTENLTRFLRLGHSRTRAAIEATRQIGVAVVGCTATLMLAFLPLLFLPGGAGMFIRSLPLAVLFTVGASLLVSLTIIPFLASLVMREETEEGNRAFQLFQRVIETSYRPLLHAAVTWPRTTVALCSLLFAGSVAAFPLLGFSLFPKADVPMFRITIEAPDGSSMAETDRAARFAESVLARHPEVARVASNVGRGNPQIFYNVQQQQEKSNIGELFVQLHAFDSNTTPALLDTLRAELSEWPRAKLKVVAFQNGPPMDAPIAIRVFSEDLAELGRLASRVEDTLAATPGAIYVDNPVRVPRTNLELQIDDAQSGRLGISGLEIKTNVRLAIAGLIAGRLRDSDGEEYEIRLSLLQSERARIGALDDLYAAGSGGAQVPLGNLATLAFESSPTRVDHIDKQRSVTVTAHVSRDHNTGLVTRDVMTRLHAQSWPAGTRWLAAGEYESAQESFGGFGSALLIAGFGILAVLVLEFRTFKSTLIVASVIPLGFVGGMAALFATGGTLSFTSMIGFIALVGIEVKTSILLVDFTNQLRARGVPLDLAIEEAGRTRFFPVLLTTLTALGGLLPLALEGSPFYSPLAVVIMGGLISSTILARLLTPVMYKLLAPEVELEETASDAAAAGLRPEPLGPAAGAPSVAPQAPAR